MQRDVAAIIDETRNIGMTWDKLDLQARKVLMDHWIYDVMITVEPIPGKKKANRKTARVTLRTAPNAPVALALGNQRPNASSNSSRTQGSSSDESAASSAERAAAPPTRPSAQAACPRTNGAGPERASERTGTASSEPQLPSATETFRAMPARPARRIADPRENDSQEASDNAVSSSSVSGGPSVPGCGASATDASGSTPTGASPGPERHTRVRGILLRTYR